LLRTALLICCLLLLRPAFAAPPLVLDDTSTSVWLYPYVEVAEDRRGGSRTAPTIPSLEFRGGWDYHPQIGYTPHTWWARVTVVSHANQASDGYVLFRGQDNSMVWAYLQTADTTSPSHLKPLQPLTPFRMPAYRLSLIPGKPSTIYLKVSNPNIPLSFELQWVTAEQLLYAASGDYLFYGLILGGMLALAAYNFLTFIKLGESSFLSLTFLILASSAELSCLNGMLNHAHLFPGLSGWAPALFTQIATTSAASFFYHLLDIRRHLPVMRLPFQTLITACLLSLLTAPFVPYDFFIAAILALALFILVAPATFILYRRGLRQARSFAWAFGIMLPLALPLVLLGAGMIPNWPPAIDLMQVGMLTFMVLLSLTQAERTRELREQNQRSEAASQTKCEFLATMSHELRTPMNAVISTGTLLQHTPLNPQQRDYVDRLETASSHMLNLINDVLDLARLESPQQVLEQQPFTLGELLANLDKLLQEHAQQKHLALNLQSWFPTGTTLLGDATRLSQVLLNLLNNALKFTAQGQVDLFIREFLQTDPHKSLLHFEVADTGIGLSQQQQQRLFEPFSPIAHSTDQRYRGTGLGLSISSKLVAAMGGKLAVESTPGEGSRFYFTLEFPLYTPHPNPPPQGGRAGDGGDGGSKHILLVDDEPMNLFFGQELLQTLGLTVTTAASGAEAIQQLQQQSFDLVFMDVSMPGMDGYATTRRIRSLPHIAALPIIALTAHAIAGERERCLAAGMDDYLTKPFEPEQLRSKVCQWTADAYNPPSLTQDIDKEPR
jgi:signal transduction histidine kinase/ActR/RegA family two-component response regulator